MLDFRPLNELPDRVRNKITLQVRDDREGSKPDERLDHWIWNGSFVQPRSRVKHYPSPTSETGHRNFTACRANERGVPTIRDREKGAISAVRYVHAVARGIPLDQVPRLKRCHEDRCVSPYCVGIEAKRRALIPPPLTAEEMGEIPDMRLSVFDRLVRKECDPEMGREFAAEDLGLAVSDIDEETWARYVRHSMEHA